MLTRVTQNHISQMIYQHSHGNLQRMSDLQDMASTGRRINDYADDPHAVGLMQRYELLIEENSQYLENISRARTMVLQTDTALLDLVDLVRDARQVAQRELNASSSSLTHRIGAEEVEAMLQHALAIANQSVEGNTLFAGHRTDLQAFVQQGGGILYQGDQGLMNVQIGPNTSMAVNVPGNELMGSSISSLYGYSDLSPDLNLGDSLADIGFGAGWEAGTIIWTDSNGTPLEVDLAGAGTVNDVITILGNAGLTASISADGSGLTVIDPGGGPLTISDPADGDTALSLGLIGTSADGTIVGNDIRLSPDWTVNLADIESLSGALPLGSVELYMNGTTIPIDLSGAVTLNDIKTDFEAAVAAAGLPPLTVDLGDNSLVIRSDTADVFEIREISGDGTARDLGLVGTGTPHRLFDVLQNLMDALRPIDRAGLRRATAELAAIEDHLLEQEMTIGARENLLDWMEGLNTDRDFNLNRNLADVRDADLFQVTSDLKQVETTYQASLMVSSQLLKMSLFDYL